MYMKPTFEGMELVKEEGGRKVYRLENTSNVAVFENERYHMEDNSGNWISEEHDTFFWCKNGLVLFQEWPHNGMRKQGVLNLEGVEVLSKRYDYVVIGDNALGINEGCLWGKTKLTGEIIFQPMFYFLENLSGYSRIQDERRLWGLIDGENIIIEPSFPFMGKQGKEFIVIHNYKAYGAIDYNGNIAIPCRYEEYVQRDDGTVILYNSEEDNVVL